ncbi:hypothetical protein GCM10010210_55290 [Pseudonocardia hydrocarbonoxydans]|uniref:Stage II sporulation protein M n=1 Tax=Pseudonocardia hydrocarbonoxydans TaxID=76726 RepID=A0A4Y3WT44_9PSEU|nr:hypothetical protein PHY01_43060 [Pseudonocardia hydrocarbonoxydans]
MSAGPGRVDAQPVPDRRPPCHRGGWRATVRPDPLCVTVAGVLLVGTIGIGWSAAAEVRLPVDRDLLRAADLDLVLAIAGRNAVVAATLFSGVTTAGVSTLLALPVLGIYVGVVVRAAVTALGAAEASAVLAPFLVIEVAAFVLAAAWGLGPTRAALGAWRDPQDRAARIRSAASGYVAAAGASLYGLPVVGALLMTAALLETWSGVPG